MFGITWKSKPVICVGFGGNISTFKAQTSPETAFALSSQREGKVLK